MGNAPRLRHLACRSAPSIGSRAAHPRRAPPTLAWVLALGLGVALPHHLSAQPAGEPDHYFLRDRADIDRSGQQRELGKRIPVFLVHGFLKDDLELEPKVHVVFSRLNSYFVKQVNRRNDPFEWAVPIHYRYAPNKPYEQLGKDFARRVEERYGDGPCLLFVHSAGALVGRFAAAAGLKIAAQVGLAPAHGGSPGATLMYANRKILEDERVDEDHFQTIEKTLEEIGVPDPVARSLAWDNSDGVLKPEEIERYGLVVQPRLPPFGYDRFDHYGVLERFVAPFAGLDFLSNAKKKGKKSDRQLEWELVGRFAKEWKANDGVVVPYPKTPADGDHEVWVRKYRGIGHREIFFDNDVLESGWEQVQTVAGRLLGVLPPEPAPDQVAVDDPPPGPTPAPPPAEGDDLGLDDLGDDLGDDLDLDLDDDLGGDEMGDEMGDDLDLAEGPSLGDPPPSPDPSRLAALVPDVSRSGGPARPLRPPGLPPEVDLDRIMRTGLLPARRRRRAEASWLFEDDLHVGVSGWLGRGEAP